MAGKTYMWPPPADHAEVVFCGSTGSVPCRVPMFMIKMFKLPVDFCGVSFPDNLYSQVVSTVCVRSCATPGADYTLCCCQECLEINPIHSYPWLLVYEAGEAQPLSINGSEAIITFLVQQYRDMIPDSFYSKSPAKAAVMMQKVYHILGTTYRATMYQYVYALFGMMSSIPPIVPHSGCSVLTTSASATSRWTSLRYLRPCAVSGTNLCDAASRLVLTSIRPGARHGYATNSPGWAKAKDSPFFEGDNVTVADISWSHPPYRPTPALCAVRSPRNQMQESAISVQFVPGPCVLGFDFGLDPLSGSRCGWATTGCKTIARLVSAEAILDTDLHCKLKYKKPHSWNKLY
eukprot:537251-Rhodomonas_salina.2